MSIATKAMVLNLSIGMWSGHRFDREATRKATEDAGADSDAARVNKHLIPREVLKPIVTAAGAVRVHFYEKTLPWKDNGDRLLTRVMYADFIEEHERLVGAFKDAVETFLTKSYQHAVERAGFRMGELFDVNDYPAVRELRHKFYIELDIDAITEAGDFRVQMDEGEVEAIRADMDRAYQQRLSGAMRDVWDRLHKVVTHFHTRMADKDAVFRQATLDNISELVKILPGLNVVDDPRLEEMRKKVEKALTGYDAKDLRQDEATRFQAAGEAKAIMDQMEGFMSAFGAMQKEEV